MFHKKIHQALATIRERHSEDYQKHRDDYWSLRHDLNRLVEALGMVKDEYTVNRYIKKGGPEHDQGG